jgi:hypothetical protein
VTGSFVRFVSGKAASRGNMVLKAAISGENS